MYTRFIAYLSKSPQISCSTMQVLTKSEKNYKQAEESIRFNSPHIGIYSVAKTHAPELSRGDSGAFFVKQNHYNEDDQPKGTQVGHGHRLYPLASWAGYYDWENLRHQSFMVFFRWYTPSAEIWTSLSFSICWTLIGSSWNCKLLWHVCDDSKLSKVWLEFALRCYWEVLANK